jgi:hypothetical protein
VLNHLLGHLHLGSDIANESITPTLQRSCGVVEELV